MTRAPLLALLLLAACNSEPQTATAPATNTAPETAAPENTQEPAPEPLPDTVKVRIETEDGPIVLALDAKHAPITTANFVRYVEEKRLDGTSFYRAARSKGAPERGFIQGGIRRNFKRMRPPIAHEPTSKTGITHKAGTISMARSEVGGVGAMGDFFITASDAPALDAKGSEPGYAAFGHVTSGMDIVRRILASKTIPNAGSAAMRGQIIEKPVKIVSVTRVK